MSWFIMLIKNRLIKIFQYLSKFPRLYRSPYKDHLLFVYQQTGSFVWRFLSMFKLPKNISTWLDKSLFQKEKKRFFSRLTQFKFSVGYQKTFSNLVSAKLWKYFICSGAQMILCCKMVKSIKSRLSIDSIFFFLPFIIFFPFMLAQLNIEPAKPVWPQSWKFFYKWIIDFDFVNNNSLFPLSIYVCTVITRLLLIF